jgi:hypothetical protein
MPDVTAAFTAAATAEAMSVYFHEVVTMSHDVPSVSGSDCLRPKLSELKGAGSKASLAAGGFAVLPDGTEVFAAAATAEGMSVYLHELFTIFHDVPSVAASDCLRPKLSDLEGAGTEGPLTAVGAALLSGVTALLAVVAADETMSMYCHDRSS